MDIPAFSPADAGIVNTIGKLGPHALMIAGINVFILFFIRPFLKGTLRDKLLPPISVVLGMVFTPMFFSTTIIQFDVPSPIVALLFQGALYGVCAIGANSFMRSLLSKAGVPTGDTMIFNKDDQKKES